MENLAGWNTYGGRERELIWLSLLGDDNRTDLSLDSCSVGPSLVLVGVHSLDETRHHIPIRGSVLYVAFGSEVGPSMEEYPQIAAALEHTTNQPFIWVIQPGSGISKPGGGGGQPGSENQEGYYPHGLDSKVGERGLIIRGWAPQLLILSHPSTGGFLSHCGWNSTAEAIGRGVPFLAWPIRGDQHYNAKLVVSHLKVGYKVAHDLSEMVKEQDIVTGIERLMGDQEMHGRAARLRAKFENGFPASSEAALDSFGEHILLI